MKHNFEESAELQGSREFIGAGKQDFSKNPSTAAVSYMPFGANFTGGPGLG